MINTIPPIRMFATLPELAPTVGTEGSAAIDIRVFVPDTAGFFLLKPGQTRKLTSGLYVEIPVGWCGLIIPRSGSGSKGLHIANSTGLIDSDYRGEIGLTLTNNGTEDISVSNFDRVCQMVVIPHYPHVFEYVDNPKELSETERGTGGFGHSGIK